jgi:hypothetical protein
MRGVRVVEKPPSTKKEKERERESISIQNRLENSI